MSSKSASTPQGDTVPKRTNKKMVVSVPQVEYEGSENADIDWSQRLFSCFASTMAGPCLLVLC